MKCVNSSNFVNFPESFEKEEAKENEKNSQTDEKTYEIQNPSKTSDKNDLYVDCCPLENKTQDNLTEDFSILKPIFLPGVNRNNLLSTNVFVGVSILPKSPLLTDSGSFQLVSFLGSLPKQSLIILVDELNRHNIKAMAKTINPNSHGF